MKYPTLAEVEAADKVQLGRWWRFLPVPGMNAVEAHKSSDVVLARMVAEGKVMDRIIQRFTALGGWDGELNTIIGWDR